MKMQKVHASNKTRQQRAVHSAQVHATHKRDRRAGKQFLSYCVDHMDEDTLDTDDAYYSVALGGKYHA